MPRLPHPVAQAIAQGGAGLSLLVLRFAALGDIVRTLPALRYLRLALPRAHIQWVTDDVWSPILRDNPDLDGVLALPRRSWRAAARSPGGWPALIGSFRTFRRVLQATSPGIVLDFHGNARSGLVSRLSGAPLRLGYAGPWQKEGNWLWSTHHVPSGDRRASRIERNVALVRGLGVPTPLPLPRVALPAAETSETTARHLHETLVGGSAFALVNPGASARQSFKKPPREALAAGCRALRRHGVVPLVVWGPREIDDARAVVAQAAPDALLAPATDLLTLIALMGRARLFLGGDSGPLHLACARGCPVVGVYGPTDPSVNRPWGVPHRVVQPRGRVYRGRRREDRAGGFTGLSADDVAETVGALLAEV